ncbi:MAG: S-layer homology domain-containing protein [Lysinibacillus sp.]
MKKIVSSILALILIISMGFPTEQAEAAQVFSDVPVTHSNYEDINYLLDKGVISKSSKYGVSDIVTREEVAVMVSKAVGLDGTQRATKFKDVPTSHKSSGYIQSAVEAGIIKGYDDGTFRPATKVTRGHMATFIARAFDLPSGNKTFKDVPVNHTAYEAVKELAAAGVTTGYDDGTFKPQNNLTRGHISAFLARAMRYKEGSVKPPVTKPDPKPPVTEYFKNCTELKKVYPDGVQVGHPAYVEKMDKDGDGWACEN